MDKPKPRLCKRCNGDGVLEFARPLTSAQCPHCKGTGLEPSRVAIPGQGIEDCS